MCLASCSDTRTYDGAPSSANRFRPEPLTDLGHGRGDFDTASETFVRYQLGRSCHARCPSARFRLKDSASECANFHEPLLQSACIQKKNLNQKKKIIELSSARSLQTLGQPLITVGSGRTIDAQRQGARRSSRSRSTRAGEALLRALRRPEVHAILGHLVR